MLLNYHFANVNKFNYLIPKSGLNMFIKQKTGVNTSTNITLNVECDITSFEMSSNNKYILHLRNLPLPFIEFIKNLELKIKEIAHEHSAFENCIYKSKLNFNDLEVKIKYRYSKFEIKCIDKDGFLKPLREVHNKKIIATIELLNIWKINHFFGPLWVIHIIEEIE